jgi:2-polyprenyl-6-methoxyphenol hydroxylase-like FAD-dependent oxidoreductase
VIGGGIGGLMASLTLRKVGIDARVYERTADPRRLLIGGGMTIFQNAMRVLVQVGLAERVEANGCRMRGMEFGTPSGLRYSRWPLDRIEAELGLPAIALRRADLQRVLVEACEPHLNTGVELETFQEKAGAVCATFADGRTATADVLVGADGISSTVRTLLNGASTPRYLGYTLWQGVTAAAPAGAEGSGEFVHRMGAGATFGWYHIGGGQLYWFATLATPEGGKDPEGGPKPLLQELFGAWQRPVPAILETTAGEAIARSDVRDLDHQPVWGRGRVTLLGDACHAMSFNIGQGACQAMEDAARLAHLLAGSEEPASALRRYEDERRRETAGLVALARRIGGWTSWRHPIAVTIRHAMLMIGFKGPAFQQHRGRVSAAVPDLTSR